MANCPICSTEHFQKLSPVTGERILEDCVKALAGRVAALEAASQPAGTVKVEVHKRPAGGEPVVVEVEPSAVSDGTEAASQPAGETPSGD